MSTLVRLSFMADEQTSPVELSQFLYLFVSTYRALQKISQDSPIESIDYVLPKAGLLGNLKYVDIKQCVEDRSFDTDPKITSIKQQSPIEILVLGPVLLLSIAAILSGGKQKIKLGPMQFEFNLNSLGDSIAKLRLALTNNPSLQTGYEFKGAKIKLSKEEYLYLNKEVNNNGGFQRFLHELQIRVHKRTREIELSNKDIEKILKYKTKPDKGGFQLRFKKIFGKHFD